MLLVVEPLHWAAASHLQLKKAYLQPDKCETFLRVRQAWCHHSTSDCNDWFKKWNLYADFMKKLLVTNPMMLTGVGKITWYLAIIGVYLRVRSMLQ